MDSKKEFVSSAEHEKLKAQLDQEAEKVTIAYRLLSILGRDIRTHLHSILGLSEIYMNALNNDAESAGELFERIYISESIMHDILNDVMELSHLVHDTEPVSRDLVSLNEMLIHLDRPVENRLELKGIHFMSESINIQNPEFFCDGRILNDILLKALKILIHYSLPGANIVLRVKEITNSDSSSIYEFNFRVDKCDAVREKLMKVLDPYTSMLREVQKDMDEVDLCIIVLKRFIALLGGDIIPYRSEPGTMDVSIQFNFDHFVHGEAQPAPVHHKEVLSGGSFSGKTALIIDDDVINLEVNVRMLEQMGMKAIGVTSGREGVTVFRKLDGKIDVILLDIRMPGVNGIELARKIRKCENVSEDLPLIALSSNDTKETTDLCREVGINEYLVKPVNPNELFHVLYKYIG